MFGKEIFSAILLGLMACARPQYAQDLNQVGDQEILREAQVNCDLHFEKSQLCLTWYWEQKPTSREKGSLIFKTFRLNALDKTAVEVDLEKVPVLMLWMPSMGHGSSPTQTLRLDVGTYRSSQVFFVMPGEWDLRFQIKDGNQVIDEAVARLIF